MTTYRQVMRAACFTLLEGFKTDSGLLQQIYRARPASFHPPFAYIEMAGEGIVRTTQLRQRNPRARIFLGQGTYDNAETADKEDILVDAFLDYTESRRGASGPGTLLTLVAVEDPVELTMLGTGAASGPNQTTLYYPAIPVLMEGLILEGR